MGKKWLGSLLLICLLAVSQIASAELNSFQAKPFPGLREDNQLHFFTGLAIFDDQGISIHLSENGQSVETMRVESFLILAPEALKMDIISQNDKLKDQKVFAVKILQEIKPQNDQIRILRYTFFDGSGKILDEVSYDDARWQVVFLSNPEYISPYFVEIYRQATEALQKNNRDTFLRY